MSGISDILIGIIFMVVGLYIIIKWSEKQNSTDIVKESKETSKEENT